MEPRAAQGAFQTPEEPGRNAPVRKGSRTASGKEAVRGCVFQKFSLPFPALSDDIPESAAGFCLLLCTLGMLEKLFFLLFRQSKERARGANSKMQALPKEIQDGDIEEGFEGWEQGAFYPAGATDRAEGKWQVIMAAGVQPGCLEIPACKTFTKTRQRTRCFEDNRSGL